MVVPAAITAAAGLLLRLLGLPLCIEGDFFDGHLFTGVSLYKHRNLVIYIDLYSACGCGKPADKIIAIAGRCGKFIDLSVFIEHLLRRNYTALCVKRDRYP